MNYINDIVANDEEYNKTLLKIEKEITNEKYVISKQQAIDNQIDRLNNQMLEKAVNAVVIGYETLIEEKDNKIEEITNTNNNIVKENTLLKETMTQYNVPLPNITANAISTISHTSNDNQKLNKGLSRVAGFLAPTLKKGDKFYVNGPEKDQKKAYRVQ